MLDAIVVILMGYVRWPDRKTHFQFSECQRIRQRPDEDEVKSSQMLTLFRVAQGFC